MGLDKSNIFKLSDDKLEEYEKDPFLDCFDSTREFACALKNDINTKETPHSLLLKANYGMGKTFFATRFTQYLRNNNYKAIYFSVWENDYLHEPFLAFSKAIVGYFSKINSSEQCKQYISKTFKSIEKIVSAITLTSPIGISISAKSLINSFKKEDTIQDFRKKLKSLIDKIGGKLVIIVDELDRCRPDYAMKTLECIKHFFDIEGLFIIIPTNYNALNHGIKSLYHFDNCNKEYCENYFQKFFNDERELKAPTEKDYSKVINQYVTKDNLKKAYDEKLITDEKNVFNSHESLVSHFTYYCYKAQLTIREVKDFSDELTRICNNFYEPIRVEWLACLIANKHKAKDYIGEFNYPLSQQNCLNISNGQELTVKDNLFKLQTIGGVLFLLKTDLNRYRTTYYSSFRNNYLDFVKKCESNFSYKDTYESIFNFLNHISKELDKFINNNRSQMFKQYTIEILNKFKEAIVKQKEEIEQFQILYGSDDDDIYRRKRYMEIINHPETLYLTNRN